MNSSYAKRFLTAALLANMTMATSMGCQPYFDGPDGIGSPDRTLELDDPTCETHEGLHGGACTTCIDESGAQTTLCAPADCYTQSLPDGTLCTTCADQAGTSETVCEEPPEQPDEECITWPMMNRMFCTLCGGEDKGVYCQPAQCVNDAAGCLTCSDADGHSYTTCGPEGDACFGEGLSGFGNRGTCMKTDRTTSVTTRWPGTDTCETFTVNGARCIECVYQGPEVSGSEFCLIDPDAELPDPLAGRPDGLPAPGTCVTETSPGGFWSCTTCVREDGEAKQTCDYAPSDTCTAYPMPNGLWCSRCTYPDGTFQESCLFP